MKEIGFRLIGRDYRSLQDFCDQLSLEISEHAGRKIPISIYSLCMHNRRLAALICSSSKDQPRTLELNELRNLGLPIRTPFNSRVLFSLAADEEAFPLLKEIEQVINKTLILIVFRKRQKARKLLVDISNTTSDANSFTYKILTVIRREIVYCNEVSIYLKDEVLQRLILSASTIRHAGPKESYFHLLDDESPISICAEQHSPVFHYFRNRRSKYANKFQRLLGVSRNTSSLILWPIRYMNSDGDGGTHAESEVVGVIQLTGVQRRHDSMRWHTYITRYDLVFINFLSEMIFIIVRQYQRAHKSEHDYARLTHGIKTTMLSSAKKLNLLRKMLFDESETSSDVKFRFDLESGDSKRDKELAEFAEREGLPKPKNLPRVSRSTIYREFNNIQSTLDDTNFQLQRVMGHRGEELPLSKVRLMQDVLMPVVRVYEHYAASSGDYPPPQFNKLTDENFGRAPSVLSNADALVSVFRNLVENSMKYTDRGRASINISYEIVGHKMVISFKDKGIGIGRNEHELIFNEGYRSVTAMRTDNRGIGHGLSYCKDVLESMSAEIKSVPAVQGANFLVTLPLA